MTNTRLCFIIVYEKLTHLTLIVLFARQEEDEFADVMPDGDDPDAKEFTASITHGTVAGDVKAGGGIKDAFKYASGLQGVEEARASSVMDPEALRKAAQVRNRFFWRRSIPETEHLPRLARDKHGEKLKKRDGLGGFAGEAREGAEGEGGGGGEGARGKGGAGGKKTHLIFCDVI
eukprot:COSAG06_NODE_167_length_21546_cov_35.001352_38_plen_175_part_00